MKFLCVPCDSPMKLQTVAPPEGGSLSVVYSCPECGYADNREVATFQRDPVIDEAPLPMEEVETPSTTTIQALADYLSIPLAKTAKAVFYMGDSGRFVFAVIRGDLEINE